MKKILLILIIFLFAATEVNAATTSIKFSNTGVPMTAARGSLRPVGISRVAQHNYSTGRVRPTLASRPPRSYGYARRIYVPPVITNYYIPTPTQAAVANPPSRLDRNNRAIIPTKSYTMNGVTYYN